MKEQDLRQVRAARNQLLFREINERLVRLNDAFELLAPRGLFVCECAHMDCIEQIEITLSDYERIRENPLRFFVAPSDEHVVPEVERVVEAQAEFFVVEKFGAAVPIIKARVSPREISEPALGRMDEDTDATFR